MSKRDLERQHQARTLKTRAEPEPRISRHDEDRIAMQATRREEHERRAYALQLLNDMERSLENARFVVPRVIAGAEHRSALRQIGNGIKSLRRLLDG